MDVDEDVVVDVEVDEDMYIDMTWIRTWTWTCKLLTFTKISESWQFRGIEVALANNKLKALRKRLRF